MDVRPKSLVGILERFVIAMTIDGPWIRRNSIIWYKRACMPSSVIDRFTVDFEYIYFFSKSEKYFFNQQKEPLVQPDIKRITSYGGVQKSNGDTKNAYTNPTYRGTALYDATKANGRNMRCVWDMATASFHGAHFAVFPEELPARCIEAGSRPGDIIMDIFAGSGTTCKVAFEKGRRFMGIEINPKYARLAQKRACSQARLF